MTGWWSSVTIGLRSAGRSPGRRNRSASGRESGRRWRSLGMTRMGEIFASVLDKAYPLYPELGRELLDRPFDVRDVGRPPAGIPELDAGTGPDDRDFALQTCVL